MPHRPTSAVPVCEHLVSICGVCEWHGESAVKNTTVGEYTPTPKMFAPAVPTATSTTSYVFDLDDVLLPTTRLFAQPHARRWLHRFKQTDDVRTTCIGYQKLVQPNPLLARALKCQCHEKIMH